MKLNNSAPPLAAGLLIATMAGCSDYELQSLKGSSGELTPTEATPSDEDENPPADTPPGLPGSSLLENTCFGLLSEDSLAPLDTETGDYYAPVLDWMQRTRIKLGVDLLQRLSHYDPEMIGDLMEEYAESGEAPMIDVAIEKMRELLVEHGVTVYWENNEDLESSSPMLNLMVGDRRADLDLAGRSMIPDIECIALESGILLAVNKTAPEDWNGIASWIYGQDVKDRVWIYTHDGSLPSFNFLESEDFCRGVKNNPDDYVDDMYWFPEGTTCFDGDRVDYDGGSVFNQTTSNRLEELSTGTALIVGLISGGQEAGEGHAYFDGSWFE